MDYSELENILKMETTSEKHILNSLSLFNKDTLTDKEVTAILNPILHYKIENNLLTLNDNVVLLPDENVTISKHHRYIRVPKHKHNFIELIYVYSGSCTQTINGLTITLKTGEMCLLDTNVVHSIEAASKNDIIINCLMRTDYFDTSFFSRLSSNNLISNFLVNAIYQSKSHNNYIVFHSGNNYKIMRFMQDLICEYYDNSICSKEIINCYIILIFSELLKVYQSQTKEMAITNKKDCTHSISDILVYIENNYSTATLTSTANHFHFHPNYLSSLIKKTTGKSYKDIIQEQKLKKACSLLKNTDIIIEEISSEIGYNNLNFFYKKFKILYGVTPSEYRKGVYNK